MAASSFYLFGIESLKSAWSWCGTALNRKYLPVSSTKEWLDTDEAKEILLGEKVNYDAVDNKLEVLAESRARRAEHKLTNPLDTDDEDYSDFGSNDYF